MRSYLTLSVKSTLDPWKMNDAPLTSDWYAVKERVVVEVVRFFDTLIDAVQGPSIRVRS